MKGMRFLPVILMLVLIGSVCATSLCDCFTSHSDAKEGADANRDENLYLMDSDEEGVEETDTELFITERVNNLLFRKNGLMEGMSDEG